MKKVNKHIWLLMDHLRDGSLSEQEYYKLCKECIELNDVRFRIKNKINYISNSILKEQKGYKISRIVLEIKDDIFSKEINNHIKYSSFLYDEIIILSELPLEKLKNEYAYDPTIKFTKDILEGTEYKSKYILDFELATKDKHVFDLL
jgi:hypothetical protein